MRAFTSQTPEKTSLHTLAPPHQPSIPHRNDPTSPPHSTPHPHSAPSATPPTSTAPPAQDTLPSAASGAPSGEPSDNTQRNPQDSNNPKRLRLLQRLETLLSKPAPNPSPLRTRLRRLWSCKGRARLRKARIRRASADAALYGRRPTVGDGDEDGMMDMGDF